MTKARTSCPACHARQVSTLEAMSLNGWVDYYHCGACGNVWNVPKGQTESLPVVTRGHGPLRSEQVQG
jgi:uncharacterized Zn finger protein